MIRGKDIAEMVGVSRQAVTAVLNGSRPNCVSSEKRAAILKIAAEHNYHPNYAAKALKTGKSNIVGVVMPPWSNPYIAELCMAMQQALSAKGYTAFFTVDNNYNPVPGNLEQLLSLQLAGMITVASSLLPDNMDIPVVSYFHDDPRFDSVCPDVELNSAVCIDYLKKCGHRKIGYLGVKRGSKSKFLNREALNCGLEFHDRWQIDHRYASEEDTFSKLLKGNRNQDLPTALIIHNDVLALKVMRSIHEHGYRVPEDFSIIGHDNIPCCQSMVPALTTMSYGTPVEIVGPMVELLIKRMKNPALPRKKIMLKPELIERETVFDLTKN